MGVERRLWNKSICIYWRQASRNRWLDHLLCQWCDEGSWKVNRTTRRGESQRALLYSDSLDYITRHLINHHQWQWWRLFHGEYRVQFLLVLPICISFRSPFFSWCYVQIFLNLLWQLLQPPTITEQQEVVISVPFLDWSERALQERGLRLSLPRRSFANLNTRKNSQQAKNKWLEAFYVL